MPTPSNDGPKLTHEVCEHIGVEPVWIRQDGELYLINRRTRYRVRNTGIRFYPAVWFLKPKGSVPLPRLLPLLPGYTVPKKRVPLPWADLLRMSAELFTPEIKPSSGVAGNPKLEGVTECPDNMSPHQWVRWVFAFIAMHLSTLPEGVEQRIELSRQLESIGVRVSYLEKSRRSAFNKARKEALKLTLMAEKFLDQSGN